MKKRIAAFVTAMLLVLGVGTPSVRAGEIQTEDAGLASLVSAFYQQGNVYAFLGLTEGASPESLSADISVNETALEQGLPLKALRDMEISKEYLFLVDTSEAMPETVEAILAGLARGLLETPGHRAAISIAVAGSEFSLVKGHMATMDEVRAAIEELPDLGPITDFRGRLTDAVTYLRSEEKTAGTLTNVVLISASTDAGEELLSQISEIAQEMPEVLFHTVDLKDADGGEYTAEIADNGVHLKVQSEEIAYQGGGKLASWIDSLYQVTCPYYAEQETEFISLRISLVTVDGTSNWTIPNLDIKTAMETGESEGSVETAEDLADTGELLGLDFIQDLEAAPLGVYLAGAAALVAVVALITLLFLKIKQGRDGASVGIPLQIVIVTGKCKKPKKVYYLNTELLIGSDPECDIVWMDADISAKHCRIFVKNGFVWLEDLNPKSKTTVEGLKIYAPNRLRSEDEIVMGSARFKFMF